VSTSGYSVFEPTRIHHKELQTCGSSLGEGISISG
jgi:hypothetical protein